MMSYTNPIFSGIRWRAVGGWFFLIVGCGLLVSMAVLGFKYLNMYSKFEMKPDTTHAISFILTFVGGIIWILTGIFFFRDKLRLAGIGAVIGFMLGILGNVIS